MGISRNPSPVSRAKILDEEIFASGQNDITVAISSSFNLMDKPNYGDIFKDVLPSVMQVIRASSGLAAQDVKFYKSIDSKLSLEIDDSGKDLINLAKQLLVAASDESPKLDFDSDSLAAESNWKPLSNVLDGLFEKIDIAFDAARRGEQADVSKSKTELTHLEDGTGGVDVKLLSKRLVKPQTQFINKIDNSEQSPFKPKLTSKPHSILPLDEVLTLKHPQAIYQDDVEVIDPPYYPHPYETEIDQQPYPELILVKSEPIPSKDWKETSAIWVDTPQLLLSMIDKLSTATEIAVDLEHHDNRTYYGLVCLMQISDRDQDWIVDTLALRDQLEALNKVFANPQIIKVFHGAFMDIIWLQRDLGLYVVSLFDTFHASKALGFPKLSLAYLLESMAQFKTSKKYQLADWRIRPLPAAMLSYARSDTHFLLNIFDQLRNKLVDSQSDKLLQVLHESRKVAKRRFEYTKFRPLSNSPGSRNVSCPIMSNNPREPFMPLMIQYNVPRQRKPVVEALYSWRDSVARKEDESPRYIMPNQLLVSIACLNMPIDTQKVLSAGNFVSDHVRLHAKQISEVVETALGLLEDIPELVYSKNNVREIESWTAETVAWVTREFTHLVDRQKELISLTIDETSLFEQSGLFRNVLDATQATIEYDPEQSVTLKHDFVKEFSSRFTHAIRALEFQETQIKNSELKQQEADAQEATEEPLIVEDQASEAMPKPERLDPNEVITIRKKQEQKTQLNSRAKKDEPQDEGPSLDYANADKILLGSNSRDRQRPKKRAFDPYSKESEGPQGVKKARRVNAGKTSTFSTRRRNK